MEAVSSSPSLAIAAIKAAPSTSAQLPIAFVHLPCKKIIYFNDTPLKVIQLNDRNGSFSALLDTGSPISFVRSDVLYSIFDSSKVLLVEPAVNYKALVTSRFLFQDCLIPQLSLINYLI